MGPLDKLGVIGPSSSYRPEGSETTLDGTSGVLRMFIAAGQLRASEHLKQAYLSG